MTIHQSQLYHWVMLCMWACFLKIIQEQIVIISMKNNNNTIKGSTYTFRANCYSSHLSGVLVLTWVSLFVYDKKQQILVPQTYPPSWSPSLMVSVLWLPVPLGRVHHHGIDQCLVEETSPGVWPSAGQTGAILVRPMRQLSVPAIMLV